jgi:alcohol dehydrogenase (cytochrome c)
MRVPNHACATYCFAALAIAALTATLRAQVTADRLANAAREPQQWLTYSGQYNGSRYSPLDQVNKTNVAQLNLQWVFQTGVSGWHETTPLVVDGMMYITAPQNHAFAVDVRTGRPLWHYERALPKTMSLCCGPQNRGMAALGDNVFMGTLDAHLVALDAKTGRVRWDVAAAEADKGYSFTGAPLAVKDKVIIGVAGGEYGIRGFIDAYDAETGKRAWRFYTIPGEGEKGNDTWAGDSWKRGGAPTWVTGSYDPELNLVYWGTGNPGPQMYGANRAGDNLYSDSLLALDPDTGTLKWHFQFTPHDVHDWDSTHTPVLFDDTIAGRPRKLVAVANRNGFFYVLDRVTGAYLVGRPYTQVTWAKELDANGRPIVLPGTEPTAEGNRVCPSGTGGTNWHQPSFNPKTRLVYFFSKEQCDTFMADAKLEPPHRPGRPYIGSAFFALPGEHDEAAVRAVDPKTGTIKWEFREFSGAWAGVFSTAGGLVFSGDGQGNFIALDADTGKDLWHVGLGADVHSAAISYAVGSRQFITIPAGGAIFTFALPE